MRMGKKRARRLQTGLASIALVLSMGLSGTAAAQHDRMSPIATPVQPGAITLNTGPLPGATTPEAWHSQYGSMFARNVTVATLTPFLPDPAKATGAAVVIAPGGGFRSLSMENEGWDLAKRLNAVGVAAFVLKYRLNQTPADLQEFATAGQRRPAPADGPMQRQTPQERLAGIGPQIADARAAFALIRSRAGEWKIDSDRIGMVGFSAGAMLTMATALAGVDAKPAFIGNVYGPLGKMDVPADAPPLFMAVAADDPLYPNFNIDLIHAWQAAKRPVEFHLFEQGGHGFGMYPKTTTSTVWYYAFERWIEMHGYLKPKAK